MQLRAAVSQHPWTELDPESQVPGEPRGGPRGLSMHSRPASLLTGSRNEAGAGPARLGATAGGGGRLQQLAGRLAGCRLAGGQAGDALTWADR